jgi:hypothetical protein
MTRVQTAAEGERQSRRNRGPGGRYGLMPRCEGGCGRPVNVQGEYFSHPLTDMDDAEGRSFGGDALALCKQCGKAALRPDLQTVRAWRAFVEANAAKAATRERGDG